MSSDSLFSHQPTAQKIELSKAETGAQMAETGVQAVHPILSKIEPEKVLAGMQKEGTQLEPPINSSDEVAHPLSDEKSASAFRTISEVAADMQVPQHVLRFWESKFQQIRPVKRAGGRRYYRQEDIRLLKMIQHLLYKQGFTIRGVQKLLRENRGEKFFASFQALVPAAEMPDFSLKKPSLALETSASPAVATSASPAVETSASPAVATSASKSSLNVVLEQTLASGKNPDAMLSVQPSENRVDADLHNIQPIIAFDMAGLRDVLADLYAIRQELMAEDIAG